MKTYPTIILENNFKLTPLSIEYAGQLFSLIESNMERLEKYFPWPPSIKTLEDEEKAVAMLINFMYEESAGLPKMIEFVIINESGNAIGMVDFHTIDSENMSAKIGYWMDTNYEGRGVMTNAVKELCSYGFNTLLLKEMTILAKADNEKSKNVAIRLGFKTDNTINAEGLISYKLNSNI